MPYGTVKVDNVTFTNNSVDATTTFSGIYASITNNLTLSGTATATTFTGTTANFTNVNAQNIGVTTSLSGLAITGGTAGFTTITGTTVTGTTANFATVSGTTVTGTTARFITITGGTAGFTTITGTTATGTTANFVTVSGTTVTGTTASFTSGIFTSLSGTTHTITSGVFASGTAALPSISFVSDPNTGIYSPGADQVAVATNGTQRLFVDASGNVGVNAASDSGASKLFIVGNGTAGLTNIVTVRTASGNSYGLQIKGNETNAEWLIQNYYNAALAFGTANTERLRITGGGLVGIGTSSPGALLEASSATGSATPTPTEIRLSSTTNAADWSTTDPWARLGFYSADTTGGARLRGAIDTIQTFSNGNVSSLVFKLDDASTGLVERMRVTYDGKVGIGDNAPDSILTVTGGAVRSKNVTGDAGFDFHENGSAALIRQRNNRPLVFYTNNAEVARLDSSGRLLVGTSTSRALAGVTANLQIEGTNYNNSSINLTNNSNDNQPAYLTFGKSRTGSVGGNTVVQNDDNLGIIQFAGADGTDAASWAASIAAKVDGTPGANDMPGRLVFSTTADGSATPTERLRITSAGVLQIADAGNITVGTTTGTKIGTATTQKLGFYNATPVVQPAAVADATDAATVITQLNDLLAKLRTLGIIAT